MAPPKGRQSSQRPTQPARAGASKPILIVAALAVFVLLLDYWLTKEPTAQKHIDHTEIASAEPLAPVSVCKVFVENSGSMDGYVAAVNSQLKTDLNALVSAIKADSLALHYINSNIIPIKARGVSAFAEGLSVANFAKAGGKRSDTALQELLERVQDSTASGEVSIFVSDMILDHRDGQSPESVSVNIETGLRRQLERRPDWSIVVWRMLSDYKGAYYHRGAPSVKLEEVKRPYYILFMGDRQDLSRVLGEGCLPSNMPLFANRTHDLSLEPVYPQPAYHLSPRALIGELSLDASDRTSRTIKEAERGTDASGKSGFAFEYSITKPVLLQSDASLLSVDNYEVSPENYSVERVQLDGTTLKVRLWSNAVLRGKVTLHYTQPMPTWIERVHSDQNTDIRADGAIDQTYGIRYILEGLRRPYESTARCLLSMPIQIN